MPINKTKNIILVDPKDRKISEIEKIIGHRFGMLHRAFSVFIFRNHNGKKEVLLQQRSKQKYHGGGLWTNTCCSHPHPGENLVKSAEKRLFEEMGIKADLKEVGKFHYIAQLDHDMTENEIDHVLVGIYKHDNINFDPHEVEAYRWMTPNELKQKIKENPESYTPWLSPALQLAIKNFRF